ncbi:MAG: helix-turn-helix domain-containing protein [Pseudonocardiaceae bacterium]
MAIKDTDPAIFEQPDMRRALAERDITKVYKILIDNGVTQAHIASLVGQQASEVSEIISGRQVQGYDVLVRVAEGFGVSRGAMGLAYAGDGEGDDSPIVDEVTEEMRRRGLLAAGAIALFNRPILGEILEVPERPPAPTPLPAQLGEADVAAIVEMTARLDAQAQYYGGCADILTPVAQRAERLLEVPAADMTKLGMMKAVAGLHNVAGWAAYDSKDQDRARYHFARAMSLGNHGDGYEFSRAAYLAGVSVAEQGALTDGLKFLQLGEMRLNDAEPSERTEALKAWIGADSACILAEMGHRDKCRVSLARALEGWRPPDADDAAEMDWLNGLIQMQLGNDDSAERFVATSLRHWQGSQDRRSTVLGEITMATLHVRSGDSTGTLRAYQAITQVREMHTKRARERLKPLIMALDERPGEEPQKLVLLARRVAVASDPI